MTADHPLPTGTRLTEAIIEPELPIIDPHIHLWDIAGYAYFAPDLLADVRAGHDVRASVYVECAMGHSDDARPEFRPVGETHSVVEQVRRAEAGRHGLAAGILGAADLTLGRAVRPVLEAHLAAGQGRFRGIRARLAYDADPVAGYGDARGYYTRDVLGEATLVEGARCLAEMNLVLDVWAFHTQLEAVAGFAERCADLPIMINHAGGPLGVGPYAGRRGEVFEAWSRGLRRLGECPNVRIKLSGLGISRMGFTFPGGQARDSLELAAAWRPYIETCVEIFGPERCVFASNFPVDRAVASYVVLLNAYKRMLESLSAQERRAVFFDNARRFYSLDCA